MLDAENLFSEMEENTRKKQKKKALGNPNYVVPQVSVTLSQQTLGISKGSSTVTSTAAIKTDDPDKVSIEIQFRLLDHAPGLYINSENC